MLDEFHIKKYLRKITGCFGKRGKGVEKELIKMICKGTKKKFAERIEELKGELAYPRGKKGMEEGKK